MRILITLCIFVGGVLCLSSCGNAKTDEVAFNKMVNESWQKRKIEVNDSMNRVCNNRMQKDIDAAVDSVLIQRGLKSSN